ncbi:MAG: diacylglycerol kinase [Hyphomicrobiales bacterium]|nr:diacylglycerol kinase [Hyphomicrobiales bacterium]
MEEPKDTSSTAPPEPVGGVKHIFAAAKYSIGGLAVLAKETAFKLEIVSALILYGLFVLAGASTLHYVVLTGLVLLVLSAEAFNTAIELIVDEISPQRSEFARKTKDLGSFAVACLQLATGIYAAYVLGSAWLG